MSEDTGIARAKPPLRKQAIKTKQEENGRGIEHEVLGVERHACESRRCRDGHSVTRRLTRGIRPSSVEKSANPPLVHFILKNRVKTLTWATMLGYHTEGGALNMVFHFL